MTDGELGEMNESKHQPLQDRLIDFAVMASRAAEGTRKRGAGLHISRQLIRCGTSVPANYAEARSSESRRDFIHKMKVCLKELRETQVWI